MRIEVVQDEIVGHVDIKAPPERVFDALCHTEKWWGSPESYQVTRTEMDLRPGGDWISEGHNASNGSSFHVKGKIVECDAPRVLSYTWNPSWEQNMPATTVTYRLEPIDGGTRVHITHGSFANHTEGGIDHYKGWPKVLGWLQGYCEA